MRYAVFADVHGNYPALKTFLEEVGENVGGYICLGDVVGYGPDNDLCLEIVCNLKNCTYLKGNHEEIFRTRDLGNCSLLAQDFFSRSVQNFSKAGLLSDKEEIQIGNWCFRHSLKDGKKWLYLYNESDFPAAFEGNVCLAHTHYQNVIQSKMFRAVNVGSIGQNRLHKAIINWGIYDTETDTITLFQKGYPIQNFIRRMLENGYPQKLIEYYA